jgi:hypothetical protein
MIKINCLRLWEIFREMGVSTHEGLERCDFIRSIDKSKNKRRLSSGFCETLIRGRWDYSRCGEKEEIVHMDIKKIKEELSEEEMKTLLFHIMKEMTK